MVGAKSCLKGIALFASAAFGREMAMAENNAAISAEQYESGQVHESLMAAKMVCGISSGLNDGILADAS